MNKPATQEHFLRLVEMIRELQSEIKDTRKELLRLVRIQHTEQLKQLKAVQESYQQAVERDEELRSTMLESADPWDGCR